mmetsp:Transcript_42682/g.106575  ORF Transcript_42682/g.106575 Transcript_42682/m.106575 type:complete len:85 (+) Transcript_42682:208-462(+)
MENNNNNNKSRTPHRPILNPYSDKQTDRQTDRKAGLAGFLSCSACQQERDELCEMRQKTDRQTDTDRQADPQTNHPSIQAVSFS